MNWHSEILKKEQDKLAPIFENQKTTKMKTTTEQTESTDLFDRLNELPQNVITVIQEFYTDYEEDAYENCATLVKKLERVGYTCDYGLDGEPYDLEKL